MVGTLEGANHNFSSHYLCGEWTADSNPLAAQYLRLPLHDPIPKLDRMSRGKTETSTSSVRITGAMRTTERFEVLLPRTFSPAAFR